MKTKSIALILLLPLLVLVACKEGAQPAPEPDALGLYWGMGTAEIDPLHAKTGKFVRNDGYVLERGTVSLIEREWKLYTFEDYKGMRLHAVDIKHDASDAKEAQVVFAQMRDLLIQKYGTPALDRRDSEAEWETPRTVIGLLCSPDGTVNVTYVARPGYADLDKL